MTKTRVLRQVASKPLFDIFIIGVNHYSFLTSSAELYIGDDAANRSPGEGRLLLLFDGASSLLLLYLFLHRDSGECRGTALVLVGIFRSNWGAYFRPFFLGLLMS